MKKIIACILVLLLVICTLGTTGCSRKSDSGDNEKVTITFVQQGQEDVKYTINKGEALLNVPDPEEVSGYDVAWSIEDFSNVQENVTVNVVLTPKTYTITLTETISSFGYNVSIPETSVSVKFMESLTDKLPSNSTCSKQGESFDFLYWVDENGVKFEIENYNIAKDITLYAIFDVEFA